MTFSGVASNFAGVPLAFAFISVLGRTGFVTVLLRDLFQINIYNAGFNLYSFAGLSADLHVFPVSADGADYGAGAGRSETRMARGLREPGRQLRWQYWRYVALPILLPSLLGTMILLFGNAFGAYATAYALTGGNLPIITILIGAQISGDVLHNPNLGYAMALGMVVIMAISLAIYAWLQRRAARWLR